MTTINCSGVDPDIFDEGGSYPLFYATYYGRVDLVELRNVVCSMYVGSSVTSCIAHVITTVWINLAQEKLFVSLSWKTPLQLLSTQAKRYTGATLQLKRKGIVVCLIFNFSISLQ